MFPFSASVAMGQGFGDPSITAHPLFQFIPFVLIFVIFYFLIIRPQQKKQKEHQTMLGALQKGDKVVTTGGIYGTVIKLGDDWLTLEIAEKVRIKIERAQITRLVEKEEERKEREPDTIEQSQPKENQ